MDTSHNVNYLLKASLASLLIISTTSAHANQSSTKITTDTAKVTDTEIAEKDTSEEEYDYDSLDFLKILLSKKDKSKRFDTGITISVLQPQWDSQEEGTAPRLRGYYHSIGGFGQVRIKPKSSTKIEFGGTLGFNTGNDYDYNWFETDKYFVDTSSAPTDGALQFKLHAGPVFEYAIGDVGFGLQQTVYSKQNLVNTEAKPYDLEFGLGGYVEASLFSMIFYRLSAESYDMKFEDGTTKENMLYTFNSGFKF